MNSGRSQAQEAEATNKVQRLMSKGRLLLVARAHRPQYPK